MNIRSDSKRIPFAIIAALVSVLLCAAALALLPTKAHAESEGTEVKILFTHDIHSFLEPTEGFVEGKVAEHGGAARLATLIKKNSDENTIYLDAGDFSQGTLFQAGYETEAFELRALGLLGCDVTTIGNHEWDHGGTGVATMLKSALASDDPLPRIVIGNLDFNGDLTDEQKAVQGAFDEYGVGDYTILEVNGLKVGVFGISGDSSIEDAPTSGMVWREQAEAAQEIVDVLKGQCDLVVCISHSGTSGDGENGEDFDLAREVEGIDVIISGHSHTIYHEAVTCGNTIVGSCGEYLDYLGSMTVKVTDEGVTCTDYELIPIDGTVAEDKDMAAVIEQYKQGVKDDYLVQYGYEYDQVIAHSPFDFMPLDEMYATHQEYPMGNLIADSYIYEANKVGVDDIDVALVGLGTIRGSFFEGDITTADAFGICSLGVGSDGSAGHPILTAYITGKELKLLVELDASLGPSVSAIKMSYSGLEYTFNAKRTLLDRVTSVHLVRPDGSTEEIDDDKLYKVSCNMYAANMLGMLNSLTKGVLSIEPKYEDGTPVEDFYTCALLDEDGREIKEWVAFADYLSSFEKTDEVSTIPEDYADAQGRKVRVDDSSIAAKLQAPGLTTIALYVGPLVLLIIIAFIIRAITNKRAEKRAASAVS